MKTYIFYDKDGKVMDKKKCSIKEAKVLSNNFNWTFEEHKRRKNDKENIKK